MAAIKPREEKKVEAANPVSAPVRAIDRDDFDRDVWSILGLPVDMATAPQAVAAIEAAARDRTGLSFVTPNVNFLVRAVRDPAARRQIIDTDLSLVDGAPLVAIGRLLGAPIKERCAGSDVFEALRRRPGFPGRRLRVFFFGGRAGSGEAAAAAINAEKRGLESAGFLNPGAGDIESMSTDDIIGRLNERRADFVLVALGAAKGQAWIDRNRGRLSAPVIAHLGAVIDFAAGKVARAPAILRRAGLEWAFRIKEEPALWRRYWHDGLALLSIAGKSLAPALLTRGGRPAGRAPGVVLRDAGGAIVIVCDGDLTADGLTGVRRAFRAAAREGRRAVLDLASAGRIDAAFLGLVLMLEKHLRSHGAALELCNLSRAHRRLFAAHAMPYPNVAIDGEALAAERGIAAAV